MEIGREDEIGTVVQSLNHMLDARQKMNQEIQESQRRMYEAEIAKKQLQVLAYRNQINPHFLYNSLDSVIWFLRMGKNKDAEKMLTELSTLFKISLSKGREIITIEDELKHIGSYLFYLQYDLQQKIHLFH